MAKSKRQGQKELQMRGIAGTVVGGLAFLVGLTIIFGSWYTIDQTERGVLLRNGAFVEVVQPGLHFKFPWIDSVYKIDMQTHTKIYGMDNTGKSVMEAYTADQQPAHLRVSVTLKVDPAEVASIYERFGGDYAAALQRLIQPPVFAYTKVVLGQYTAAKAITNRAQLNSDVAKAIREALQYDPIFTIESVQVEDISFSGEYIKSVEQRMQAEVEVQKLHQNLAREKVQADIVVTQAKAQADSVVARAEAEAKAIKLRGDAEAQAIQARGEALNRNANLVNLVQAERWDGKLPVTMVPGGATPLLNIGK